MRRSMHAEIFFPLLWREISARYRGAIFGAFWSLATPLAQLLAYSIVFGVVFRVRWPGADEGLGEFSTFLFIGLLVHGVIAEAATKSVGVIYGNAVFVRKVVFPLGVLPSVAATGAFCNFFAGICILLVFRGWLGEIHLSWIFLPLFVLPLWLLAIGVAWLLAALGVFFRDLAHIMPLFLMFLMYVSPIFYPLEMVPEAWRWIVLLNPLTELIDGIRHILLLGTYPNWEVLFRQIILAAGVALFGWGIFARLKPSFADTV